MSPRYYILIGCAPSLSHFPFSTFLLPRVPAPDASTFCGAQASPKPRVKRGCLTSGVTLCTRVLRLPHLPPVSSICLLTVFIIVDFLCLLAEFLQLISNSLIWFSIFGLPFAASVAFPELFASESKISIKKYFPFHDFIVLEKLEENMNYRFSYVLSFLVGLSLLKGNICYGISSLSLRLELLNLFNICLCFFAHFFFADETNIFF